MANDAQAATTRPRRIYKSTFVVACLAVAGFCFLIVPGSQASFMGHYHGWPWIYGTGHGCLPPEPVYRSYLCLFTLDTFWRWPTELRNFAPWILAADVGVALAGVAAITAAWQWRRRRSPSAWQVRLSELFVLTVAAAGLFGWWASWHAQHQRQVATLAVLGNGAGGLTFVGPRWLWHVAGPWRTHDFEVAQSAELELPDAGDRPRIAAALAELETLEYLSIRADDEDWLNVATRAPRLHYLALQDMSLTAEGVHSLARLPQLTSLRLESVCRLNRAALAALQSFRHFVSIDLDGVPCVSEQDAAALRQSLPAVQIHYRPSLEALSCTVPQNP